MRIAQEIIAQLGGSRFMAMTGAKNFLCGASHVAFRLPSRFARDGINLVRIDLDEMDTYTVRFSKLWGAKETVIAEHTGIYCDTLQRLFSDATGLDTHL